MKSKYIITNLIFIMKKYLALFCSLIMMCALFSGCGKEDPIEENKNPLEGTRWEYLDMFEEDGIDVTYTYSIVFHSSTATWRIDAKMVDGSATLTDVLVNETYDYQYDDGLVVLTPQSANLAYLEGTITSNIKMEVTNVSYGEVIGTFYKK